ncbi:MAG: Sir2 histone deacetylase Hst2 [Watsoniomyces obsoletus]|nr:MAG: Sir2 histone deacetylase Hst2 [Watsoniomyces obsoletus]
MFYSEALLSKTGPLARVWLSANLERKLSKTHILQSNIESHITAIVDQGQAPMALRLSGQLLLGVVRIYSRKARYLLDDCNEALMKLKMAFRPGNVDLPANHAHGNNPAALTLPDVLTDLDLLPSMPDASLLLEQPLDLAMTFNPNGGKISRIEDITLMDHNTQLMDDIEMGRNAPEEPGRLEDEVLALDLGLDDEPLDDTVDAGNETSVHVGRDAPPPRALNEEFGDDLKMMDDDPLVDHGGDMLPEDVTDPIERGRRGTTIDADPMDLDLTRTPEQPLDDLADDAPLPELTPDRRERDSMSPLSVLRPSEERELEEDYLRHMDSTAFEPEVEEEESMHQPRRTRKGKLLQPDSDTTLPSSYIKRMQDDRSRILKPASFLPRDPVLMALLEMQQNGGFVSSILGDGRGRGWAPELRGVLSLEVVRRSGLKRKHDDRRTNIEDPQEIAGSDAGKRPRLDMNEDDVEHIPEDEIPMLPDVTVVTDGEIIDIPADDHELRLPTAEPEVVEQQIPEQEKEVEEEEEDEEEQERASPLPLDAFDDTVAPRVHPADSGPVALGTKHAVHMLRDRFGESAADSPSQRNKASVLFQDLLPEKRTTKADATKMFFEVLVLATKDAVKVEQESDIIGGPIRVRGRRGLWGSWAEHEAAGEMAEQEDLPPSMPQVAVEA